MTAAQEIERKRQALEQKRFVLDAQIKVLRSEFAMEEREMDRFVKNQQSREAQEEQEREAMIRRRMKGTDGKVESVMTNAAGGVK